MSEHTHDHSGAFGRVAWFWGILGAIEFVFGLVTATGALISDGIHYLSDCGMLLISSLFVGWLERLLAHRHFFRHNLRVLAALGVYTITIVVVGVVGLLETYHHLGNAKLQLALGVIGVGGNMLVLRHWRKAQRHANHHGNAAEGMTLQANINHVGWDIGSSSAIALAGLMGIIYSTRWWSFGAAASILALMLWHNIPEMVDVGKHARRKIHCQTPAS